MASPVPIARPPLDFGRIEVESRAVPCDGGDGPLGHPRVWLRIEADSVVCPYCSRCFVLKPGAGHEGH